MNAQITVDISDALKSIDLSLEDKRRKADRAFILTMFDVEREAKRLCPVDTGRLRASIHTEIHGPLDATVATGVDYAAYVEFGTSRARPQPFMTPAAEIGRQKLRRRLEKI